MFLRKSEIAQKKVKVNPNYRYIEHTNNLSDLMEKKEVFLNPVYLKRKTKIKPKEKVVLEKAIFVKPLQSEHGKIIKNKEYLLLVKNNLTHLE